MTELKTDQTVPKGERIYALDAYRGVLMMLGIVIHSATPFFTKVESATDTGVLSFSVWFVHLFRMPAFFVLSGFFGALLWHRRGAVAMIWNRVDRLLYPLAFLMLFLFPLLAFIVIFADRLMAGDPKALDIAGRHLFHETVTRGDFQHLWFLYYLVWLSFGVPWFLRRSKRKNKDWGPRQAWVRRNFESPWRFIVVFGGLNMAASSLFFMASVPVGTGWIINPAALIYYAFFYALGWALYASGADLRRSQERAWTLVIIGVLGTALYSYLRELYGSHQLTLDNFNSVSVGLYLAVLSTWSVCLFAFTRGLMGLFFRYASGASSRWRYLSDASYWVYLVHLFPTQNLPKLFTDSTMPVLVQFLLTMGLTALIGFVTYDLFVRSTFIGRRLNGRVYPRGSVPLSLLGLITLVASGYAIGRGPYNQQMAGWALEQQGGIVSTLPLGLVPEDQGRRRHPANAKCRSVGRYLVCSQSATFDQAQKECRRLDGRLVRLETKAENDHVAGFMREVSDKSFWFDLSDRKREGVWVDSDGVALSYSKWAPEQPDNEGGSEDCAQNNYNAGRWNDVHCKRRLPFVCERVTDAVDVMLNACSVVDQVRLDWQAAAQPQSMAEVQLDSALADLCSERTGHGVERPLLKTGLPNALSPRYRLVPEGVFDTPGLRDLSASRRQALTSLFNGLEPTIEFGQEQVRLTIRSWDRYQSVSLPYTLIRSDAARIKLTTNASEAVGESILLRKANGIYLEGASRTWRLKPIDE
ncbi:MAG: acyltransferase family protein [Myxococcota bacterium]|nr:acyltransferase family protein [Myxococcota bacterium]